MGSKNNSGKLTAESTAFDCTSTSSLPLLLKHPHMVAAAARHACTTFCNQAGSSCQSTLRCEYKLGGTHRRRCSARAALPPRVVDKIGAAQAGAAAAAAGDKGPAAQHGCKQAKGARRQAHSSQQGKGSSGCRSHAQAGHAGSAWLDYQQAASRSGHASSVQASRTVTYAHQQWLQPHQLQPQLQGRCCCCCRHPRSRPRAQRQRWQDRQRC